MKRIIILISVLLSFSSCEKIFMGEDISPTPTNTFDYLWKQVDECYALFDVKGVDWDEVHNELRPLVSDSMSDDSLFSVLAEMINRLNDGHANVWYAFDASRSEEVFLRMYGRCNIDLPTVALHYLGSDYHSAGGFQYNTIHDGEVIYIRYGSFSNSGSSVYLKHIMDRYPNAEGIVFDLRQNGGGNIQNEWNIMELLPNHGQKLYETQIKSGPAHDDFTPYSSLYAPDSNEKYPAYEQPFVILTDRGSYSATSFFALCMKSYSSVIQIGDTTGGGLGLPNGGQLPNGWYYRFSVTRTLSPDGKNYENGIPPDEVVMLSPDSVKVGIDNVIERACRIIKTKNANNPIAKHSTL